MDRRDVEFWLREADRVRVMEELVQMNRIRLAMWGDGPAFKRAVSELEQQLGGELRGSRREVAAANWADLKELGRG